MNDWMQSLQNTLDYVEAHLTEDLDVREIARQAGLSTFYFQRIFSALCGMGIGEYIRNRRLTLAAEELLTTPDRIIDIAAKYGYESPDSFNRAFQRFHGLPPSAARKPGAHLHAFGPIQLEQTMEEIKMLEYRIAEKPQFTVMGLSRHFHSDTSYEEIPKWWQEVMSSEKPPVCGIFGICMDEQDKDFEYLIADNYIPWNEIPEGCVTKVIPASTWAVFPCRGPLPQTLQDVNTRMWTQWLPNCKNYRLAANMNIEVYGPPTEKPEDYYCEIWLPVEKL